jgi:hypothetical protein
MDGCEPHEELGVDGEREAEAEVIKPYVSAGKVTPARRGNKKHVCLGEREREDKQGPFQRIKHHVGAGTVGGHCSRGCWSDVV